MSGIITLLTDFGTRDSYVGQMKGVLLSLSPQSHVVDISHDVPAQNVRHAARMLPEYALRFPAGTVHVVVVDPGVGTRRSILAAACQGRFLVLPDNGILSFLETKCDSVRAVDSRWYAQASHTFHGRDVMAPVAAHLANGGAIDDLGGQVSDLVQLGASPTAANEEAGLQVVAVDGFGNLILDAKRDSMDVYSSELWKIEWAGGVAESRSVKSYGARQSGELVLLYSSQDEVELAVVNGSASRVLGIGVGEFVKLSCAIQAG